jgi:lipopolysaccharide export LptBFGC system permease protein LptF
MERLEQMDILLEKDLDTFLSETGKPNELNFLELKEYIQARQRRGLKTPRLLTELHLKIAFPMAPFVLTLLVCSFALSPRAGVGAGALWLWVGAGSALLRGLVVVKENGAPGNPAPGSGGLGA